MIEYNVMRDCPDMLPDTEAAAGIWPWSCDNTLVQFNEVSGHKARGMHRDLIRIGIAGERSFSTIIVMITMVAWYWFAMTARPTHLLM